MRPFAFVVRQTSHSAGDERSFGRAHLRYDIFDRSYQAVYAIDLGHRVALGVSATPSQFADELFNGVNGGWKWNNARPIEVAEMRQISQHFPSPSLRAQQIEVSLALLANDEGADQIEFSLKKHGGALAARGETGFQGADLDEAVARDRETLPH